MRTIEERVEKSFRIKGTVYDWNTILRKESPPVHTVTIIDAEQQESIIVVNADFMEELKFRKNVEITIRVSQ